MRRKWFLLGILAAVALLLVACAGSDLPKQPGQYDIQPKSIAYDGQEYSFLWVDKDKSLHPAQQENIKMVQDARTFLEMRDNEPILHLSPEESISVHGEDSHGRFTTFWAPFLLGRMTAGSGPVIINQPYPGSPQTPGNTPTYHYPPAGSFGRDDTLNGSVTNNKPLAPDYDKVSPAPYAVSGKSGGAGAGAAATDKSGTITGQAGGTGAGTAASEKGGFKAGTSSYSSKSSSASSPKVGAGSGKSTGSSSSKSSTSSSGKSSTGSSGGKAGGGARGGGK